MELQEATTTATEQSQSQSQNGSELATTTAQTENIPQLPVSENLRPKRLDYFVVKTNETKKKKHNGIEVEVPVYRAFTTEKSEKQLTDAKAEGRLEYEQSVVYNEALNKEGMFETLPDEKQLVKNHNDGLKSSRVGPRMKRILEACKWVTNPETGEDEYILSFQPKDYVLPIHEELMGKASRSRKSKAEFILEGLRRSPMFKGATDEQIWAFFEQAKAANISMPGITDITADDDDDDEVEEDDDDASDVTSEAAAQPTV